MYQIVPIIILLISVLFLKAFLLLRLWPFLVWKHEAKSDVLEQQYDILA